MSNATVQFFSEALGEWTRYNVILPEHGEGRFPVLMQLHGLSDDCDAWIQRSNFLRHAESYPMVMVLPDGGTSGYLNWKVSDRLNTHCYENLLIRDIPAHLTRQFNVMTGPWAIGSRRRRAATAPTPEMNVTERFSRHSRHRTTTTST